MIKSTIINFFQE